MSLNASDVLVNGSAQASLLYFKNVTNVILASANLENITTDALSMIVFEDVGSVEIGGIFGDITLNDIKSIDNSETKGIFYLNTITTSIEI